MRTLALLALSTSLIAGCAGPTEPENAPGSAGGKADQATGGPSEIRFARDDRPVDGLLIEIQLTRTIHGDYDATLRRAWFDRLAGEPVEETDALAFGLECDFDGDVFCRRDDRPVDGVLRELHVYPNQSGTFDATLRTAYFDRLEGVPVDETETLGENLERVGGGLCGDGTPALCLALPPECPEGLVPEVVNHCWGACVDPLTCQPPAEKR